MALQIASDSALSAVSNLAGTVVREGAAIINHRRENPEPMATKSAQTNVTTYSLFTKVQCHTDNGEMSSSGGGSNSLLQNVLQGAAVGAGATIGVLGVVWLYDKFGNKQVIEQLIPARPIETRGIIEEMEEDDDEYATLG